MAVYTSDVHTGDQADVNSRCLRVLVDLRICSFKFVLTTYTYRSSGGYLFLLQLLFLSIISVRYQTEQICCYRKVVLTVFKPSGRHRLAAGLVGLRYRRVAILMGGGTQESM